MKLTPIFRDAVPGLAGVVVYDRHTTDVLGRYTVSKTMRVRSGKYVTRQKHYVQRDAALSYALRFLSERAAKEGVQFTPGDGAGTVAFRPIVLGGLT